MTRFARIPAGSFDYGDPTGDGGPDERPARRRDMPAFAISRTPVTVAEYLDFLCQTDLAGAARPDLHGFPARSDTGLERGPDGTVRCPSGAERHPVVRVSWHGATAFCAWLGARMGVEARLPTEAEWQYAAGGPEGYRWALGDVFERSDYVCNTSGPAPVASGRASRFGLYDITGNVFEWCGDSYHVPPGAPEPAVELPGSRIVKGGGFILRDPAAMRNAKRFSCDARSCLDCVGFRVLCEDAAAGEPA